MKLTTTLNLIRECSPCTSGWKTLNKYLGSGFDMDQEINLLTILESNGVQDMLWCLRATLQESKKVASQLAIEFAMQSLPIFEGRYPNDLRPRNAIQAAKDYNDGAITVEELRKARIDAAAAAYADGADSAAFAAVYAAAYADSAAFAAVHAAAAADSAAAAADSAAAAERNSTEEKQAEIIRMVLED